MFFAWEHIPRRPTCTVDLLSRHSEITRFTEPQRSGNPADRRPSGTHSRVCASTVTTTLTCAAWRITRVSRWQINVHINRSLEISTSIVAGDRPVQRNSCAFYDELVKLSIEITVHHTHKTIQQQQQQQGELVCSLKTFIWSLATSVKKLMKA